MGKTSYKKSVDKKQSKQIKKNKEAIAALEAPIERKFFDTVTTIASAGGLSPITNVSASKYVINGIYPVDLDGTVLGSYNSLSRRLGQKITMTKLRCKGTFLALPTALLPPETTFSEMIQVRHLIVRFPNTATKSGINIGIKEFIEPALYDITTTPDLNAPTWVDGFRKVNPKYKYDILYDKTFKLSPNRISGASAATAVGPVGEQYFPAQNGVSGGTPSQVRFNINLDLNHVAEWGETENSNKMEPSMNMIQHYFITNRAKSVLVYANTRLNYIDA